MTNSSITDAFLKVADERLERRIDSIAKDTTMPVAEGVNSDIAGRLFTVSLKLRKGYHTDIGAFNEAGKALSELGFAFEPIDPETAFQTAYDRIREQYRHK